MCLFLLYHVHFTETIRVPHALINNMHFFVIVCNVARISYLPSSALIANVTCYPLVCKPTLHKVLFAYSSS